jgi:tripartite-type tricarboxylate transporter receptor subunit TctC
MFSTSSLFAIYPHIYTRLDYDPVADFTPISSVAWFDLGLAAGPMSGATDMKQLVDWWRKQGQDPVYGDAPGAGSSSHFTGIALALATGLPLKPVHYKDSGVGVIDMAAGRLPMLITGTKPLVELHKSGKIKLLAVSGEKRQPLVPEVPTLVESGYNVVIQNSAALYGPAKLPREIVDRLHAALAPMLARPDALAKLADQGMVPFPMNGAQVAAYLVDERRRFERLARDSGYTPETL